MKNMKKAMALILLTIMTAFMPSAIASVCNDFQVTSAQNGNVLTVILKDQTGFFDPVPPNLSFWGEADANRYDDLNVQFDASLATGDTTSLLLDKTQNVYNFDFNQTTPGSYDFNLLVQDVEGSLPEAGSCLKQITVVSNPVVDVNTSQGTDVNIGTPFVFDVNAVNNGGSDANNLNISLTPNPSANFDANTTSYGDFNLSAGPILEKPFLITPRVCTVNAPLGVAVNYTNTVGVSQTQVSKSTNYNIRGPDLEVVDLIFNNNNPIDGNIVTVTATVKNVGNLNITNPFDVNFSDNGVVFDSNTVNSLDANSSVNVTADFNTSGKIGTHDLLADADAAGAISECDSTDNNRTEQLLVNAAPGSGFDINGVSFTVVPSTGPIFVTITMTLKLKSDNSSVTGVDISFRDNGATGTEIAADTVDLVAGTEKEVVATAVFATSGSRPITVVIDPDDLFNENDETNNQLSQTVSIIVPDQGDNSPTSKETTTTSGGGGGGGGGGGVTTAFANEPSVEPTTITDVTIPSLDLGDSGTESDTGTTETVSGSQGGGSSTDTSEGTTSTSGTEAPLEESTLTAELLNKESAEGTLAAASGQTTTGFLGLGRRVDFGETGNTGLTLVLALLVLFGIISFGVFLKKRRTVKFDKKAEEVKSKWEAD